MTCFWDGIMTGLGVNVINRTLGSDFKPMKKWNCSRIEEFILLLKNANQLTKNVTWNGHQLTESECLENFSVVEKFTATDIANGHNTCACDPFLCLVCELFRTNLDFHFNGTEIMYQYKDQRKHVLYFKSDDGHFESISKRKKRVC